MLRLLLASALCAALPLAGCAGGPPADPAVAGNHPGNPDPATAALPPRTDTLAIPLAGSAPAAETPGEVAHSHAGPGDRDPMVALPGESAAGGHEGMAGMAGMDHGAGGHGGMEGMDHGDGGAPGMRHDHDAMAGSDAAGTPAPAEAPAAGSPAAAVWTCPMHPDVHEGEPGKCPICGMKLLEKEASQ